MIYNSLLFVYDKNVKYQQQTDFKYLNNMHCKNMAIYASKKKKKKNWDSVPIEANGCTLTFTGITLSPELEPMWGITEEDACLSFL